MFNKVTQILKNKKLISSFLFCLLIMQPILDIVSYFAILYNFTSITTAARMLMFAFVVLWAFLISRRKKIYFIVAGIVSIYWILHVVVNISSGYISIVQDTAMFIRTIQGPILALVFITFLKESEGACEQIGKAFWINYLLISFSIILSYIAGMPVYTYEYSQIGIKGWFYTGNSQSCILAIMGLVALCYVYKKKNECLFAFSVFVIFANLYYFGTRVTYLSIFVIAFSFIILLIWNKERRVVSYAAILLGVMVCLMTYHNAPCYINQSKASNSFNENNELIQEIVGETVEIPNTEVETLNTEIETTDTEKVMFNTEEELHNIQKSEYLSVYNASCPVLVERFGIEKVAEKFNYSLDAYDVMDNRKIKVNYCSLIMDEKNIWTHLFGFEYMEMIAANGEIFDPENDFPALFYLYGYVGIGMYIIFIAYFAVIALKDVLLNIRCIKLEKGALAISLVLMLGCAELSGNVLRRPNVSIYLSIMLAYLYIVCKKGNYSISE